MHQDDALWCLPRLSEHIQLGLRMVLLTMLVLALMWLLPALYDAGSQGNANRGVHVAGTLCLLVWLLIWKKLYASISNAGDSNLLWRECSAENKPIGQPTRVRVLFDAGTHLLIHVHHGSMHAWHWVSTDGLPTVWRWRLAARNAAAWHYLAHD